MAKNGVKFSRPGVSVDQVADYDSYFYSGWPWPRIAAQGDVMVTNSIPANVANPMGMPVFYMVYGQTSGLREYGHTINSNSLAINTMGFYPEELVHYYIFTIPLNKNLNTEKVNITGQSAATSSPYGILYNSGGIESGSKKDFSMNSDFRSPLIHAVVYGKAAPLTVWSGSGVEYTFDLPYQPLVFGFASPDNENFTMVNTQAQTPPKLIYPGVGPWVSSPYRSGSVIVSSLDTYYDSIVILKNPYDLGSSVEATL